MSLFDMKPLILLLLLLTLMPVVARADIDAQLKQAQARLSAGEYEQAFSDYSRLAEGNQPQAQFTLALFYQLGWGRAVDAVQACRWHEKAAAGGIPASLHYLGDCLRQGVHQPAAPEKAAYWYQKAAEAGHLPSLCSLAELYVAGAGVPRDPARGLELCRQAAERGVVAAAVRMGQFLLDAERGDPVMAANWFEAAAQKGSPQGQYYLATMIRDGQGRHQDLLRARSWYEQAASQGYVAAYFPVAQLYFHSSLDTAVERESQKQAEADLAKSYLWLSATIKRSADADEISHARIMLAQVLAVMPDTWIATLDARLAQHLSAFTATP